MESLDFNYDFHKNYNLKIQKSTYKGKGLCGLINLGNKCFLNSILQCLSHSLKMTDYILSTDYKEDMNKTHRNEHYLLSSYILLINHMWDTNQIIKPKSFIENLGKFHRKYFSLQQQDSHECLLYILDILHKSLSYEIEVEIKGQVKTRMDELMKKSLESWNNFFEKEYSFIIETFYGNLINNINCIKCDFQEDVFEPYNNLSLSLANSSSSLKECLDNYFKNDYIIESWKCEKCKEYGCKKSSSLWTIPNYLIINLKRFKQESSNNTSKNSNLITFPLKDLNLTSYITKDKNDINNYIYDLYAINYHHGDLSGGHYWSACKNLDGNWYSFNDGNVSRYVSTNIESQLVTKDAYILFYHRKFIKKTLLI
jgi:ubiquitin carboxyl-terminal hydrolase 8